MRTKIITSIFILFSITTLLSQLNEGHIKFEIDASANTPEMEMAVGMMQGSTMDLYFSKNNTRSELNMGTMMKVNTIVLGESGDVLVLMNGMMGNIATPTSLDALKEKADSKEAPNFDIELTKKTKTIAGYKCKKAIMINEDGDEMNIWYTPEIFVNTKGQSFDYIEKIPGFPLAFEANANGLLLTFSAVEVIEGLDKEKKKEVFSTNIPEGYKELNPEELNKMGM